MNDQIRELEERSRDQLHVDMQIYHLKRRIESLDTAILVLIKELLDKGSGPALLVHPNKEIREASRNYYESLEH